MKCLALSRWRGARVAATVLLLTCLAAVAAPAAEAGEVARPLLVTVDDLPLTLGRLHQEPEDREEVTRRLLAALARHGVRAVGFVTWGNVRGEADLRLLDLWLQAGHELGNHSDQHLSYSSAGAAEYAADAEEGRAALQAFLSPRGKTCRFFRFPMLREGDTPEKLAAMRQYLQRSGQRNLPVTVDNQDWSFEEPWVEAARGGKGEALQELAADYLAMMRLAVRGAEGTGDRLFGRRTPQVLLLHASAVSAANWDALFDWLERSGHRFAAADEVLADPAFAEAPDFAWHYGCGLWDRIAHLRAQEEARGAIAARLREQAAAWSRGDIEAFCSIYADDALFVTPSAETRGRREIEERYRKKYPGGAAMGTLTLELIECRLLWGTEVSPLGDALPGGIHGASVVATWTLSYPDRPAANGRTLLVLLRLGKEWRIVQDASM